MSKKEVQRLSFWTTGEGITSIIRDMWTSCLPKNALDVIDSCGSFSRETAVGLCIGKYKVIGDSRKDNMKIVDDGAYIEISSPNEMVGKLEEAFIDTELTLRFHKNTREKACILSSEDDEDNLDFLSNCKEKIVRILEQLECAYPLIGKSMRDLPIHRLIMVYTEIESTRKQDFLLTERKVYSASVGNIVAADIPLSVVPSSALEKAGITADILDVDTYVKKAIADNRRTELKPEDLCVTIFTSGYITPSGKFYGCADARHYTLANEIFEEILKEEAASDDAQILLDDRGWVRFSMNRFFYDGPTDKWTQRQIKTVSKYLFAKNKSDVYYNGKKCSYEEFINLVT